MESFSLVLDLRIKITPCSRGSFYEGSGSGSCSSLSILLVEDAELIKVLLCTIYQVMYSYSQHFAIYTVAVQWLEFITNIYIFHTYLFFSFYLIYLGLIRCYYYYYCGDENFDACYVSYTIWMHRLQKPRGVGSHVSWLRPHCNCANTLDLSYFHTTPQLKDAPVFVCISRVLSFWLRMRIAWDRMCRDHGKLAIESDDLKFALSFGVQNGLFRCSVIIMPWWRLFELSSGKRCLQIYMRQDVDIKLDGDYLTLTCL